MIISLVTARTSLQMFLQRQTAHEPLLTLVAQPGTITVVLAGVNQHGVLRDELEVAAGAVDLTVGGSEGRTLVLPQKVLVEFFILLKKNPPSQERAVHARAVFSTRLQN